MPVCKHQENKSGIQTANILLKKKVSGWWVSKIYTLYIYIYFYCYHSEQVSIFFCAWQVTTITAWKLTLFFPKNIYLSGTIINSIFCAIFIVIQWYKMNTMVADVLTCVRVPTVIELISLYRRKIICSQLLIRVPSLQASVEKSVNKK